MTGNNRPSTRSIEFAVELLPTLLHALIIARNTHMMSGQRTAQKRMEALMEQVEALMPPCLRAFDDVDVISIFEAAANGPLHFAVHHRPTDWRPTRFRLLVISESGRHWLSEAVGSRDEIEAIARDMAQVLDVAVSGFPSGVRYTQEEAVEAEKSLRTALGYDFTYRTSFLSFPEGETYLVHAFPSRGRDNKLPALEFSPIVRLHAQSID